MEKKISSLEADWANLRMEKEFPGLRERGFLIRIKWSLLNDVLFSERFSGDSGQTKNVIKFFSILKIFLRSEVSLNN